MGVLFKPKWKRKDGRSGESAKWYAKYTNERGKQVREPLDADKAVATAMLGEIMGRMKLVRAGLATVGQVKAAQTIDKLVAEYRAHLSKKVPRWVSQTIKHIETVIEQCGFARPTDIESGEVELFLNDLTDDKRGTDGEIVRGVNANTRNIYLASMRSFVA